MAFDESKQISLDEFEIPLTGEEAWDGTGSGGGLDDGAYICTLRDEVLELHWGEDGDGNAIVRAQVLINYPGDISHWAYINVPSDAAEQLGKNVAAYEGSLKAFLKCCLGIPGTPAATNGELYKKQVAWLDGLKGRHKARQFVVWAKSLGGGKVFAYRCNDPRPKLGGNSKQGKMHESYLIIKAQYDAAKAGQFSMKHSKADSRAAKQATGSNGAGQGTMPPVSAKPPTTPNPPGTEVPQTVAPPAPSPPVTPNPPAANPAAEIGGPPVG